MDKFSTQYLDQAQATANENSWQLSRLWLGLFLGVVLVFVTGCNQAQEAAEEVPAESLSGLSDYYNQEINWVECDDSLFLESDYFVAGFSKRDALCTKVRVPASYQDLSIGVFEIQLMKDPGEVGAEALFINPGGPGGSGVELVQYVAMTDEIRANFDVIGFDPRGVKDSDEIRCDDEKDLASYFQFDFYIDSDLEVEEYEKFSDDYYQDCVSKNPLWWLVNTENTVRDLDILREVVGSEKLNFSGSSYGTTIAIEYLRLFGENAGKIILDSPVENNVESDDEILRDLASFDEAFERLFEKCAQDAKCPGESVDEVAGIIKTALEKSDEGELTGVNGISENPDYENRTVGSGALLFDGIFQMTYYPVDDIYSEFSAGMNELKILDYPVFEWYGLSYHGYDPETMKRTNSDEILEIVNCLDTDSRRFDTAAELLELDAKIKEVAPLYHYLLTPENDYFYLPARQGCEWSWLAFEDPAIPDPPEAFLDPVNETGKPVLIIASRNDNATPYSGAVSTAKFLRSPLVTLEGDGHGVAYSGNKCLENVIRDYLINDVTLTEDIVCE